MEESIVQEEVPEYREFEDSACEGVQKQRVGKAASTFLTQTDHAFTRDPDEILFYDAGLQMLNDFFRSEFPDSRPKQIQARSQELFDYAFKCQKEQKQGARPFGHHDPLPPGASLAPNKRQKYSLKKTFIIASIWIACHDYSFRNEKLSLPYLCHHFQKNITEAKAKSVFESWQHGSNDPCFQKTQIIVSQQKQIRNNQRRRFDRSEAHSKG
jgi:hypothetical protein